MKHVLHIKLFFVQCCNTGFPILHFHPLAPGNIKEKSIYRIPMNIISEANHFWFKTMGLFINAKLRQILHRYKQITTDICTYIKKKMFNKQSLTRVSYNFIKLSRHTILCKQNMLVYNLQIMLIYLVQYSICVYKIPTY